MGGVAPYVLWGGGLNAIPSGFLGAQHAAFAFQIIAFCLICPFAMVQYCSMKNNGKELSVAQWKKFMRVYLISFVCLLIAFCFYAPIGGIVPVPVSFTFGFATHITVTL